MRQGGDFLFHIENKSFCMPFASRPRADGLPKSGLSKVKKMNQPLRKFRADPVSCALWENEVKMAGGRSVRMLKATFERRYRDKEGNWQSSRSFSRSEIPLVKYCLNKAFEAMIEERDVQNGKVGEEVIEQG